MVSLPHSIERERREDMRRNTKRDINGIKVKPDKDKYVLKILTAKHELS
jgi:hypothetical protein